jgi:hypothetical protein
LWPRPYFLPLFTSVLEVGFLTFACGIFSEVGMRDRPLPG